VQGRRGAMDAQGEAMRRWRRGMATDMAGSAMPAAVVIERICPRCGRSNRRAQQARWCSDSCKVLAWQERHRPASGPAGGSPHLLRLQNRQEP